MNGVFYRPDHKKWIAMLNHDKQRIHLGQFDTMEEAQAARDKAVKRFEEAKKKERQGGTGDSASVRKQDESQ